MCMDGKSIIYFSDFVCVNANHRCNSYASCEDYGINRYEEWGGCTKGDSLTLSEGITTIPATGAYTNENKEMLMIVITVTNCTNWRGLLNKWTQVHLQTYCKQLGCSDCFERLKRTKVGPLFNVHS